MIFFISLCYKSNSFKFKCLILSSIISILLFDTFNSYNKFKYLILSGIISILLLSNYKSFKLIKYCILSGII